MNKNEVLARLDDLIESLAELSNEFDVMPEETEAGKIVAADECLQIAKGTVFGYALLAEEAGLINFTEYSNIYFAAVEIAR